MSHPTTERSGPSQQPQREAPREPTPPRTGRPPFWRRRFIVDAPFQWHMISRAVGFTAATLLLVSGGLFGPIFSALSKGGNNSDDADPAIAMLYMHGHFWWIAGGALVVAGLGAARLSHRIAGPLVRVKRNLQWLGEGRLPAPLQTRRNDHLKVEVAILNRTVAGIAARIEAMRLAQADLAAALQRGADRLEHSDDPLARAEVVAAQAAAARLAAELANFRATGDVDALTAAVSMSPVNAPAAGPA